MRNIEVEHYPLKIGENPETVDKIVLDQMTKLCFETPLFYKNRGEMLWYMYAHYANAILRFSKEEKMRNYGNPNANLFYHNRDHAVYQTGFDATAITRAILRRQDQNPQDGLAKHLSLEGAFSIPVAGVHHDEGYVYEADACESFVHRTPIHIEESKKAAIDAIDRIGLPDGMDIDRVKRLVAIGIHGTSFPYSQPDCKGEIPSETVKKMINELPIEWRKEAQIVRLSVQFADLAGQTTRVDQFPNGLNNLRKEMNIMETQKGDIIIGKDYDEMEEKWECFLEFVRKTVGKTGRAFFGPDNAFEKDLYIKTPASSR